MARLQEALERRADAPAKPAVPGADLLTDEGTPVDQFSGKLEGLLESLFNIRISAMNIDQVASSFESSRSASESLTVAQYSSPQGSQVAYDYAASYQEIEKSRLAAEGTLTTADGQSFAFSFDYASYRELTVNSQARGVAVQGRPPDAGAFEGLRPPPREAPEPPTLPDFRQPRKSRLEQLLHTLMQDPKESSTNLVA
jgi:hypothetical protein